MLHPERRVDFAEGFLVSDVNCQPINRQVDYELGFPVQFFRDGTEQWWGSIGVPALVQKENDSRPAPRETPTRFRDDSFLSRIECALKQEDALPNFMAVTALSELILKTSGGGSFTVHEVEMTVDTNLLRAGLVQGGFRDFHRLQQHKGRT